MDGVSLLLTLAALGPVYQSRTGVDQQQEYVLQIEPEIVQLLAAGEEIFSDVPANAAPFRRLCITILPKDSTPTRHTATGEEQFRNLLLEAGRYASRTPMVSDAPPTVLWPVRTGASPDQVNGVTTGWEPDAKGNQQYIVQIESTLLSTLAIGDEIYVPVDPAAGRIVRFIVKTGREALPHVGGQPSSGSTGQIIQRQPSRYNTGLSDSPAGDPRDSLGYAPPSNGWNQSSSGQGFAPTYGNSGAATGFGNTSAGYDPGVSGRNFEGYRGGPGAGGQPQPPAFGNRPVAGPQPEFQTGSREYNTQYPEMRVAGRSPSPVSTTTPPLNPGAFLPSPTVQPQADKPWGPLLFVTFALFFSIGGNLYLAYTALEFHGRYRNAIERLRSAARSA